MAIWQGHATEGRGRQELCQRIFIRLFESPKAEHVLIQAVEGAAWRAG